MKIIGLQIENLRKINAVDMKFTDKGLIQIRGKNEQGKSTILDAIEILLKGKKSIPNDVITHGETNARILSTIGDYKIERMISEDGKNKLKISKEGRQITTTPQAFLDALVNELTFDPRPFIDKDSNQKLKFLMSLLDIDFTEVDTKLNELETERTYVGREIKEYGELPILTKVVPVEVVELAKEKELIDKNNSNIERGNEKVITLEADIKSLAQDVIELQDKIKDIELQKKRRTTELAEVMSALGRLGKIKTTDEVQEKITNASEINKNALAYRGNQEKKKHKKEKEDKYQSYTDGIKKLRDGKEETLKATKMPVEGLEIKEDGVYFEGTHSDNWSDSQAIKISFKLCVTMQPQLRAVFIDRGESYDTEQLQMLDKWANESDIQVFIAIVDSGEVGNVENAIYIEEGEIVEA